MNKDKLLTIILGLGLALIPIHRCGNVFWAIGFALVLIAVAGIIVLRIREHKLSLGPKCVYIPLAIIVLSMLMSDCTWEVRLLGVSLLTIYVASVNLKHELKLLVPAVVIGCASIVVCNVVAGVRTGGMYSPNNYNIAVGAIVVGSLLCKIKHQWILVSVVLIGLAFSGAEEALVALTFLGITLIIRRDWSRRLLLSAGVLVLVVLACAPSGVLGQLWHTNRVEAASQNNWEAVWEGRLEAWKNAVTDIKPFGYGYTPFYVRYSSIHSVPLRILYETGPLASLAWLFVVGYVMVKTKRKYIPTAIIALSLFDHMLWTQLSVYTFTAIGIAMRDDDVGDLIFKEKGEVVKI